MDGRPLLIPLIIILTTTAVMVAGSIVFDGAERFSQSAATIAAIAKWTLAAPADFVFTNVRTSGHQSRLATVRRPSR